MVCINRIINKRGKQSFAYCLKNAIQFHTILYYNYSHTVYTRILAECKTQNKTDEIVGSAYTRITITKKITIWTLI